MALKSASLVVRDRLDSIGRRWKEGVKINADWGPLPKSSTCSYTCIVAWTCDFEKTLVFEPPLSLVGARESD